MLSLYPYQEQGIVRSREALARGILSILLVAATGAGKTVCFSTITASVVAKGKRACIVAPRREIIRQTYKKLVQAELDPYQIGVQLGGVGTHRELKDPDPWVAHARQRPKSPIQLGTVASFTRRAWVERNEPPDLMVIDEAHQALAPSYVKLVHACRAKKPGMAVLGFTATPMRADRKPMRLLFDEMIVMARPHELAEWINPATGAPVLMRPRVFTVGSDQIVDTSKIKVKKQADGSLDYDQAALNEASNKPELIGGIVEHWKQRALGRPTVCFAVSIAHSKNIVQRFNAAGIQAEHLDGDMNAVDRDAILARLENGRTKVVVNCNVLVEGWDFQALGCCILARPTKSEAMGIQMMGRVLRYAPGKDTPIILDHAGFCEEYGGPMFVRSYSLDVPPKRKHSGKMGKTCQNCMAVNDIGNSVCESCGEPFPVYTPPDDMDESHDLLVEIPADHPARKRVEEYDVMRIEFEEENQRRYEAGLRPWKRGYLDELYRQRYGLNPPAGHKKAQLTDLQIAAIELHDEVRLLKQMGLTSFSNAEEDT